MNNENADSTNPTSQIPDKSEFSSADYFKSLERWVQEMYFFQNFNALFMQTMVMNSPTPITTQPLPQIFRSSANYSRQERRRYLTMVSTGIECRIPALWKRLVAELIDFIILFILKLGITLILVDVYGLLNIEHVDLDKLLEKSFRFDTAASSILTSDLILVEIIHRFGVCAYETFWLCYNMNGHIPGSTPGKKIMRLKVVYCERVSPAIGINIPNIVLVEPGSGLGITDAFIRSVVKNFIMTLVIPFTFTFLYFQYNRTSYDIMSHSLVIEYPLVGRHFRRE